MQTMREFVERHGIEMECQRADSNPYLDMPRGSSHYTCRLRFGRRTLTTPFSQGSAITHTPRTEDVLNSLASDSSGYESAGGSFDAWCSDFGFEPDEEARDPWHRCRWKKTFRAVEKQAEKLKKLLGLELYDELLYRTEQL